MKNRIQKMALTLAIMQTLTLSACSMGKKVVSTNESTKVVQTIRDNSRNIDLKSSTFVELNNPYAIMTRFSADAYDLKGHYIGTIANFSKGTAIKQDLYNYYYLVKLEDNTEVVIHASEIYEPPKLIGTDFSEITNNKNKIFTEYTDIYDYDGTIICGAWDNYECTAVATNGEYTLISMKDNNSNSISGFVKNESITDKYNQVDFYAYSNKDTTMYCEKELIREAYEYKVKEGQLLKVLFITDTYAGISMEGGRTTAYMDINDLELIDNFEMKDGWFDVNSFHYLSRDAYLFKDKSFNNPSTLQEMYQRVYVLKSDGEWSYVLTDTGEYGYMETFLLYKLPNLFLDIDISEQMTRLFENNEILYDTYCITGKDSSPTDYGYFEIYEKLKDTYLQDFNPDGSLKYRVYVNRWMGFNRESQEGAHGSDWQDGHFGDIEWHHYNGSLGCDNIPSYAAVIIYDYVDIGTRVLVHK